MCSVVEIKNSEEYNIYYHSPESLEKWDKAKKEGDLAQIYEFHSDALKNIIENDILVRNNKVEIICDVSIREQDEQDENKNHKEVKQKISNDKQQTDS